VNGAIVPIRGDRSAAIRPNMATSALVSAIAFSTTTVTTSPAWNRERVRDAGDLVSQLARIRQWEADAAALLRPAAFHTWAAGGSAPQ